MTLFARESRGWRINCAPVPEHRPPEIPLFVATAPIDDNMMQKLPDAFAQVAHADRLQPLRDALLVSKFETPTMDDYETFHTRSAASEPIPRPMVIRT